MKTTAIGNVRFSNENTYKSIASLCVCVFTYTLMCACGICINVYMYMNTHVHMVCMCMYSVCVLVCTLVHAHVEARGYRLFSHITSYLIILRQNFSLNLRLPDSPRVDNQDSSWIFLFCCHDIRVCRNV